MPFLQAKDIGINVAAFLDLIAWSEGTSRSKYTKNAGYDIIVGGLDSPNVFTSYKDHPGILVTVNTKGLKSTAAGRYQVLKRFWPYYQKLLKLPDFSPASQDKLCIQLIKEQRAYEDVVNGRIETAIQKCANIWASFPGAGYGQYEHKMQNLLVAFAKAGGQLNKRAA